MTQDCCILKQEKIKTPDNYPSRHKKANDGCDEWSKLHIYYFFSFCSSFEPHGSHRTSSTRKRCHIGQTFSTPPTYFDRSKFIEISSTRGERTYRKKMTDFSNAFGPLGIYRNSNQLRKRIMSKGCFRVL